MAQKRDSWRQRVLPAARAVGKTIAAVVWLIGIAGMPDDLSTWAKWVAWLDPEWVRFVSIVVGVPIMALYVYPRWLDRRRGATMPSDRDRFRSMQRELYRLSQLTSNPHHYSEIRVIGGILEEMGIATPPASEIGNEEGSWKPFLERASVLASFGRIEKARTLAEDTK